MNDNNTVDFSQYDDRQILELFFSMIEEGRLNLGVAYVQNPETGYLTHNYLVATSGELSLSSAPDELTSPFVVVPPVSNTVH